MKNKDEIISSDLEYSYEVQCPGKMMLLGGHMLLQYPVEALCIGVNAGFHARLQNIRTIPQKVVQVHTQFMDYKSQFELNWDSKLREFKFGNFEYSDPKSNPYLFNVVNVVNLYLNSQNQTLFMLKSNFVDISYDDLFVISGQKTGLGSSSSICVSFLTALLKMINAKVTERLDVINKYVIFKLAHQAHCKSMGKAGSGFDIYTNVFGCNKYIQDPKKLELNEAYIKNVHEVDPTILNVEPIYLNFDRTIWMVIPKVRTEEAETTKMLQALKSEFCNHYFQNSIRKYHSSIINAFTSSTNYTTSQFNMLYTNQLSAFTTNFRQENLQTYFPQVYSELIAYLMKINTNEKQAGKKMVQFGWVTGAGGLDCMQLLCGEEFEKWMHNDLDDDKYASQFIQTLIQPNASGLEIQNGVSFGEN